MITTLSPDILAKVQGLKGNNVVTPVTIKAVNEAKERKVRKAKILSKTALGKIRKLGDSKKTVVTVSPVIVKPKVKAVAKRQKELLRLDPRLKVIASYPPAIQLRQACLIKFNKPVEYCNMMEVAYAKYDLNRVKGVYV